MTSYDSLITFQMRPRISIRGYVRPSVRPSVRRSVGRSVGPLVRRSVRRSVGPSVTRFFSRPPRSDLCRVYGLVSLLSDLKKVSPVRTKQFVQTALYQRQIVALKERPNLKRRRLAMSMKDITMIKVKKLP